MVKLKQALIILHKIFPKWLKWVNPLVLFAISISLIVKNEYHPSLNLWKKIVNSGQIKF